MLKNQFYIRCEITESRKSYWIYFIIILNYDLTIILYKPGVGRKVHFYFSLFFPFPGERLLFFSLFSKIPKTLFFFLSFPGKVTFLFSHFSRKITFLSGVLRNFNINFSHFSGKDYFFLTGFLKSMVWIKLINLFILGLLRHNSNKRFHSFIILRSIILFVRQFACNFETMTEEFNSVTCSQHLWL